MLVVAPLDAFYLLVVTDIWHSFYQGEAMQLLISVIGGLISVIIFYEIKNRNNDEPIAEEEMQAAEEWLRNK